MEPHSAHDYVCDHCQKNFKSVFVLNKHVMNYHVHEACDYCGEDFASKQSMKVHIRQVHNSEKTSQCNKCGKLFIQSSIWTGETSESVPSRRKNKKEEDRRIDRM